MYVCSSVYVFFVMLFYFVCVCFYFSIFQCTYCLHLTCLFFSFPSLWCTCMFIIVINLRFGVHTFLPHNYQTYVCYIIHYTMVWASGNQIDEVQEFNFLGITIDQNITWTPHIRKISIKISRVIGVLRKLKHIFPQHILRLIYNSLIHPHLIYGLNLWGFKHKRITILQKKTIRILAFRPYISQSTSAFKELKIPMLKDLYTIQLYKIYYKNIHNILPVYFQRFLPNYNNGSAHNHNLRHQALRLPITRKEYYVQSTKYQLF